MNEKLSLNIIENGPIRVSNCKFMTFAGKPLEINDTVSLCRCGESTNAPFCDGKHRQCGFSDKNEQAVKSDIITWEGNTLRTFFNKNICMHVFYCKPLKTLREKELAGDVDAAEAIKANIALCPSGALSYQDKQDQSISEFDDIQCIDIIEGGEIRIQSQFDCQDVELQEHQPCNRVTLCRCGLSKNKPFCDGQHRKKADFK